MPAVTLTDGDFGSGVEARADSSAFYLPDPARPGAFVVVPLAEVVEMETVASDRKGQVKAGLKLSARGFMAAGPIGLAAGLLAAGRVKDVSFSVVLADGRTFLATANAETFAEIHSAQLAARAGEGVGHPVDAMIARYIEQQRSEAAAPSEPPQPPTTQPPTTPAASPASPPTSNNTASRQASGESTSRPVFGKRRRSDLPPAG
jgi:hypothetical protein